MQLGERVIALLFAVYTILYHSCSLLKGQMQRGVAINSTSMTIVKKKTERRTKLTVTKNEKNGNPYRRFKAARRVVHLGCCSALFLSTKTFSTADYSFAFIDTIFLNSTLLFFFSSSFFFFF